MSVNIACLTSRALVKVQGPDWRPFLQGLISQDVTTLSPEDLRYGALLMPQGRLLFDFLIWGSDEGCDLETDAASADALAARLMLYRLRAKVTIAIAERHVFAGWDDGPLDPGWRKDPRAPGLGFRSLAPQIENKDASAYQAHRLALGVPDIRTDAVDTDYPIELNLDLMHAFDFQKGCFIGQETSSRMHRRGGVKNRLTTLSFDGPPLSIGADIFIGDRRAGSVRASAGGRALALVRLDRIQTGPLTVEGRCVSLATPTWLHVAFAAPTETAVAPR